jgi:hypothetical protein
MYVGNPLESKADRLKKLRVRIPPGSWNLSCECCGSGKVQVSGRSLIQRSPTDCGCVIVCGLETSRMRRSRSTLSCSASEKWNPSDLRNVTTKNRLHRYLLKLTSQLQNVSSWHVKLLSGCTYKVGLYIRVTYTATLTDKLKHKFLKFFHACRVYWLNIKIKFRSRQKNCQYKKVHTA